ncbi:MAG: hypothetical protein QGG36_01260 [Pirellulaceae bacterium]|jgi:hypothetical protein|nr:hypothetical protein [Pirellulaceae bacterium]MDP7014406.1 hypothetical protein [Pirellulaceae bacterium]
METARLIVCEQTGDWAASLRRMLDNIRVYETRSLRACWKELETAPASLICLQWPFDSDVVWLARLAALDSQFPRARAVVLSTPAGRSLNNVWREAGAVHVVYSQRDLEEIKPIVERHLASAPAPKYESAKDEFWNRLPWSES